MDEEQRENSAVPKNLLPHVYKKGQSGNPNGRPTGSISLKQYAKRMLEQMTPEEREEYMEGLPKQFIWEMAEGKAESKTEVTGKDGAPLVFQIAGVIAEKNNLPTDASHTQAGGNS